MKDKHTRRRLAELELALIQTIYQGKLFVKSNFEDFSLREIEAVQKCVMKYCPLFTTKAASARIPVRAPLNIPEENPWLELATKRMEEQ